MRLKTWHIVKHPKKYLKLGLYCRVDQLASTDYYLAKWFGIWNTQLPIRD